MFLAQHFQNKSNHAARILTRQFVLPFLLGLKFNMMTILPLIFAGIILLLKKAIFLGKFAMFVTGLLGFGNFFSVGQFSGVNSINPTGYRPFGNQYVPLGDPLLGGGSTLGGPGIGGGLSGGYYKSAPPSAPIAYHDFATTEKEELQYADQFYNFEKKLLQNKATEKSREKEPKPQASEQAGQANTYRNFVWQSTSNVR